MRLTRTFHCAKCGQTGHTSRNHGQPSRRRKALTTQENQARNLQQNYRLGIDEFLRMRAAGCAICGCDLSNRTPDVDHDHGCNHPGKGVYSCRGCVRDLLCRSCNLRVGGFERGSNSDEDVAAYLGVQRPSMNVLITLF